ncbi:hypothetical protein FY534_05715 [Alicyclobacillus sp. TC]|uniref:type II secretion system F family protein n=1 Tax=Alicyclobacillus sp. TC TaxID=2606450 RepID=UPI0019330B49|nr:type II secretion system F family protein [Alicyclobacillus sp. TC]QRF23223.1 hypothetical protein FY534_05715 [Alicyclobacillus sp. TC]
MEQPIETFFRFKKKQGKRLNDHQLKDWAQLLDSGISVTELIELFSATNNSPYVASLYKGNKLSDFLRDKIPSLQLSVIEIAENTGNLSSVLKSISERMQEKRELKNEIIKKLIYPLILWLMVVVFSIIVKKFILPSFLSLYMQYTRHSIIRWEYIVLDFPSICLFAAVIGFLLSFICFLINRYLQLDWLQMSIPIPCRFWLILNQNIFLVESITELISAGVPFVDSLEKLSFMSNIPFWCRNRCKYMLKHILLGNSIGEIFSNHNYFDPFLQYSIKLGEKTGDLVFSLLNYKNQSNLKRKKILNKILHSIEPAMTLWMGCNLGLVVYSTFMPMYKLINQMSMHFPIH